MRCGSWLLLAPCALCCAPCLRYPLVPPGSLPTSPRRLHPRHLPRRPAIALLAASALLACAGGASAALTPAQLEKKVAEQAATIAALTQRLDALQKTVGGLNTNVASLLPLAPLKAQLLAVSGGGRPRGGGPSRAAPRCPPPLGHAAWNGAGHEPMAALLGVLGPPRAWRHGEM